MMRKRVLAYSLGQSILIGRLEWTKLPAKGDHQKKCCRIQYNPRAGLCCDLAPTAKPAEPAPVCLLLWRLLLVFGLWLPDSRSSFVQPRFPGRLGQDPDAGWGMGRASADLHRGNRRHHMGLLLDGTRRPALCLGRSAGPKAADSMGLTLYPVYLSVSSLLSSDDGFAMTASAKMGQEGQCTERESRAMRRCVASLQISLGNQSLS